MEERFKEIEKLLEKEEYTKAIKLCDKIIKEDENCAMAYSLKAEASFFNYSNNDVVFQLLEKALELDPNLAHAYYVRGMARDPVDSQVDKLDMDDYSKAIELDPDYFRAYFERGILKKHLNDFKGAIEDFTSVIERNPDFVDAYFQRAELKYGLKDYYGALMDYEAVLSFGRNYDAAQRRISCYFKTGQIKKGFISMFTYKCLLDC